MLPAPGICLRDALSTIFIRCASGLQAWNMPAHKKFQSRRVRWFMTISARSWGRIASPVTTTRVPIRHSSRACENINVIQGNLILLFHVTIHSLTIYFVKILLKYCPSIIFFFQPCSHFPGRFAPIKIHYTFFVSTTLILLFYINFIVYVFWYQNQCIEHDMYI